MIWTYYSFLFCHQVEATPEKEKKLLCLIGRTTFMNLKVRQWQCEACGYFFILQNVELLPVTYWRLSLVPPRCHQWGFPIDQV